MKSKTTKSKKTADPITPLEIFLDGLDAGTDGRGYGEEHEQARLLLEAAPKLLAACEHAAQSCHHPACKCKGERLANPEQYCTCHVQKARAAIRKTELRATT